MKTLNKLYIVATAALSLTACNSDDNYLDAFQGDPNAVRFSVSIADNSQAKLQTKVNTFDNTNPAFEDGDEVTVSAGDQEAVTYKLSSGSWVPGSSNYLIWKTETDLQFDAYYPATTDNNGASMETFTQPTTFSSVADLKAADYMTFSGEKDRVKGEPVALEMQRKMARVIFQVGTVNNQYTSFTPAEIKMNINSKGYKGGDVDKDDANLTTVTTYPMTTTQDNNEVTKFYALVSPTTPQSTAEFLTINGTADNNPVELKITGIPEMKAGNSYTYTLTIGKNVAKVANVKVEAWANGGVIENGTGVAEEVLYPKVDAENHIIYTGAEDQLKNDDATEALIKKALGDNGEYLKVVGPVSNKLTAAYTKLGVLVKNLDLSGATITTLPTNAFSKNNSSSMCVKTITLPTSVTAIPKSEFWKNTTLESVICKGKISSIGAQSFADCGTLTLDLTANDDVPTIDEMSFSSAKKVTVIVKDDATKQKFEAATDWSKCLKNNVTIQAYPYADAATHTVYTNAVDQLKGHADVITTALGSGTELTINGPLNADDWKVVCSLGTGSSCPEITSINLYDVTMAEDLKSGLNFASKSFTDHLESVTLPKDMTAVPQSCFADCTKLTTLTLPSHITSVGTQAFNGCTGLTSVTFKGSNVVIGSEAFYGSKLETVTIEGNLSSIGYRAFSDVSSLNTLDLSAYEYKEDNIPTLGDEVFEGAYYVNVKVASKAIVGWFESAWSGKYNSKYVTIQAASSASSIYPYADANTHTVYTNATGQITKDLVTTALGTGTALTINGPLNSADFGVVCLLGFEDNNWPAITSINLYDVTMAEDLKSGLNFASPSFTAYLESVTLPKDMTAVPNYCFADCTKLTTLTLLNHITSVGKQSFRGCTGLTSVTFKGSDIAIGIDAFSGCTSLTTITVEGRLSSIGEGAFGNSSLKTLDLSAYQYKDSKDLPTLDENFMLGYNAYEYGKITVKVANTTIAGWFESALSESARGCVTIQAAD